MSKIKKSVRRRSRSLVGFASKDLCETIPNALSPPERLLMVVERSFQYALSVVQKEMIPSEDFDISNFRNDVSTCWEKIKNSIEEQNLCHLAVTENTISDQSASILKDGHLEQQRLEAEAKRWNEKILNYREDLRKVINNPPTISDDFEGKDTLFDYSEIIQHTSALQNELQEKVDSLEIPELFLEKGVKLSSKLNEDFPTKCQTYFEPKGTGTPRQLIKKLEAASKIRKHCRYS